MGVRVTSAATPRPSNIIFVHDASHCCTTIVRHTRPHTKRIRCIREVVVMRSLRFIPLTGVILFVRAGNASGVSKCAVGCRAQSRMCVQTGKVAWLACVQDCRENADPSAVSDCKRGCAQTFSATRSACTTDAKSCKASCAPAPDLDETCLGSCGIELVSCLGPALQAARACVTDCKTAPDRLTCLQSCLAAAQADDAACGDDFTTCLGACVPPAP